MLIENHSKLVMIGDSITDYERARPYGEGLGEAIGKSYVMLVDAMLKAIAPESRIRVVNMGIGGNTTRDLKERWQSDVLDLKPEGLNPHRNQRCMAAVRLSSDDGNACASGRI